MNLIDCVVVDVVGEPVSAYGKWWVNVIAESYGREATTKVMCETLEEAKSIKPGFVFQA